MQPLLLIGWLAFKNDSKKIIVSVRVTLQEDRRIWAEIFSSEVMWPLRAEGLDMCVLKYAEWKEHGESNGKVKADK